MAAPFEVLFTSEVSGQLWNTCVWDPYSGTSLTTFKGNSARPRTLCLLGQDLLLCGVNNKSLLHVWSLSRKEQIQQRIVCSGEITAVTVSPDGLLCVVALAEKIHVWQVASGRLLVVLSRHYQRVNCLKFSDDGSHFVSAGEDSLVLVWSIASVLAGSLTPGSAAPEPRHAWSQHSLPVTDLAIGKGGIYSRVASASLDNTVRLWELASGDLLVTLVFEHSVMSVVLDDGEHRLFAGTAAGHIHQANLFTQPVRTERHIADDAENSLMFVGHTKQVTCLTVSLDATTLVSGSHDCTVKLWDIYSRQCIRTILHKGAITNLLMTLTPPCLTGLHGRVPPTLILPQFQRHLCSNDVESPASGSVTVTLHKRALSHEMEDGTSSDSAVHRKMEDADAKIQHELETRIAKLQSTNSELYQFAVNKVLNGNDTSNK